VNDNVLKEKLMVKASLSCLKSTKCLNCRVEFFS